MALSLIWAQTPDGVIGADGALPWHVPEDLARFRRLTQGHPVLMGRRTWESLPSSMRPLPGRENIVLSGSTGFTAAGAIVASSLDDALAVIGDRGGWVVGGGSVYAAALPHADRVEVTIVDRGLRGDTFAPVLDERRWMPVAFEPIEGWYTSAAEGTRYRFVSYAHRPESAPAPDPRLQAPHRVRCDWGRPGARAVAAGADRIAVVVDVLTFSTTTSAACTQGIAVAPFRWHDPRAEGFAAGHGAVLARDRSTGGPSLSPGSVRGLGRDRLVLPSPNGATTSLVVAATGAPVVAGSVRAADAVARWVVERLAEDPDLVVALVPTGEGWPDGALRPCAEDLWGAGAVADALVRRGVDDLSEEAELARNAWLAVADDLPTHLLASASGRELVERGWADDVRAAARLDADGLAPVLVDGWFVGH
jgi:2-phosphosulfolactate phosphatase